MNLDSDWIILLPENILIIVNIQNMGSANNLDIMSAYKITNILKINIL